MKIEILVFDGCPHAEEAERLVRDTVRELDLTAAIEIISVRDNDEAVAWRFLGSPSIRIDGKDIEAEENELTQYSMRCRIYHHDNRLSGVPPKDLLVSVLSRAASRQR